MQRVQVRRKIKILVFNFCKCILCIILKHSEYKWIKLINHYSTTFAGKLILTLLHFIHNNRKPILFVSQILNSPRTGDIENTIIAELLLLFLYKLIIKNHTDEMSNV